VAFLWNRVGEVRYPLKAAGEEAMIEAAIEAGAEDVETEEEEHVVLCAMSALNEVTQALAAKFGEAASAKFVWRPQASIATEGDNAEMLMKLLTALEDLDDVQTVFSNEDISEAELKRLAG
jgi:transcriptional/translational regulatory protein YebC/TACO1